MDDTTFDAGVQGISALRDPVRRRVYGLVAAATEPVSRDRVARELGLARSVAVAHLERLEADGLLEAEFRRLSGRRGPGAGRPAKLYRRAAGEVSLSLPPRRYELVARILARALSRASAGDDSVRRALAEVAVGEGRSVGEAARAALGPDAPAAARSAALVSALRLHGYEPRREGDVIVLGNCPFQALARECTDVVCGLNHDMLTGLVAALGADDVRPRLEPAASACCVRLYVHDEEETT
ncbi:MAG TPA: helix-turn-helix domain-containing protein [Acidimicrobiales bacterium]|nr:helix-turn-helix domain-containing protein [Acidimicrobiales bacterium]